MRPNPCPWSDTITPTTQFRVHRSRKVSNGLKVLSAYSEKDRNTFLGATSGWRSGWEPYQCKDSKQVDHSCFRVEYQSETQKNQCRLQLVETLAEKREEHPEKTLYGLVTRGSKNITQQKTLTEHPQKYVGPMIGKQWVSTFLIIEGQTLKEKWQKTTYNTRIKIGPSYLVRRGNDKRTNFWTKFFTKQTTQSNLSTWVPPVGDGLESFPSRVSSGSPWATSTVDSLTNFWPHSVLLLPLSGSRNLN